MIDLILSGRPALTALGRARVTSEPARSSSGGRSSRSMGGN